MRATPPSAPPADSERLRASDVGRGWPPRGWNAQPLGSPVGEEGRAVRPVDQPEPRRHQRHRQPEQGADALAEQRHTSQHAENRRQHAEGGQARGGVACDQPEPGEVAGRGHADGLVEERRGHARRDGQDRTLAQQRRGEQQQRRRHGELAQQRERRRRVAEARRPHHQDDGRPQGAAEEAHGVAEQRGAAPRRSRRRQSIREGEHDPAEGHAQAGGLGRRQPVARQQEVRAGRHEEGRGVEEHHAARGGSEAEAQVEEQDLQREYHAQRRACRQGAAPPQAAEVHTAPAAPREEQRRRHDRTQAGLQHRRDALAADFHGHAVDAPRGAEQQHREDDAGRQRRAAAARGGDRPARGRCRTCAEGA